MSKKDKENGNNPFEADEQQTEQQTEQEVQETEQQEQNLEENLKNEIDDLNNKYLRLAADFDNYRKRQAQERESLLKYGCADVLTKLITVLDTFERAKEALINIDSAEQVKESFEVVLKQFQDTLKKCGLEKIEAVGQKFDPNKHEAVSQTPTTEQEDGTILNEMQKGYKMGDKILRPAMVNVTVNEGQS